MENRGYNIFFLFSLIWTPIQVIFSSLLVLVFAGIASIIQIINPDLKTKFILATIFWKKFCHLIINIGLLCRPFIVDRRSPEFHSSLNSALYICNHQSIWDIPLTLYVYQIAPIMKKELMSVPFFGIITKASTAIPVDRKDKDSRRNVVFQVLARLKLGLPVQFYPEGTRNKFSPHPKNFDEIKSTLLEIVFKNNITVIPSAVWGTRYINNRYGFIRFPVKLGIIVQKELHPKDFSDEKSFAQACWEKVVEGYDELNKQLIS